MKWVVCFALLASLANAEVARISERYSENGKNYIEHGTATCVEVFRDGTSLWLTCSHCVDAGGSISIRDASQQEQPATLLTADPKTDVAFVASRYCPKTRCSIATKNHVGQSVFVGYPGGRDWWKRPASYDQPGWRYVDGRDGDSGGPFLVDGEIVAILSGGQSGKHHVAEAEEIMDVLFKSCRQEIVRAPSWCDGPQCQPQRYWVQPNPGGLRFQPPVVVQPPTYNVTPIPEPQPTPAAPTVELDSIRPVVEAVVIGWLEENAGRFRGRDGERGPRGFPGEVSSSEIRSVVDAWLASNVDVDASVAEWMDANADRFRGQPGRDGKDGSSPVVDYGRLEAALVDWLEENGHQPVEVDYDRLEAKLVAMFEEWKDSQPDEPEPEPEPESPESYVYVTSTKGAPELADLDARVLEMKQKGFPVCFVDLQPKQSVVQGVPQLHMIRKNKTIQGKLNVSVHLTTLVW